MKENISPDLHQRIAARLRQLRAARGLSLEALALHCGVSRSMLSLIERGESSPTAVILEKLATGLDVTLASLFDAPAPDAGPVARLAAQPVWQDPHSGYVRRNVSPSATGSPLQLVEVDFPPLARVSYDSGLRQPEVHQLVWLLEGQMDISLGAVLHRLERGDCLAMQLDQPVSFHNPGPGAARYAVVLTGSAAARR